MFYRRKQYVIYEQAVEAFNRLFNEINLPNQLKHGAQLVGRWMTPLSDGTVEIFALWAYDSEQAYSRVESAVRSDQAHAARIKQWFDARGGREHYKATTFLSERNDVIIDTVDPV